jgi:hypothetical protein
MNQIIKSSTGLFKKLGFVLSALFVSMISFAQDKSVDVNINTNKGNNFWGQPWVWVVGAAVFILLLVAVLRSGRKD